MKLVRNSERKEFRNGKYCTAYEYALGNKEIDGAVIVFTGRYPERGMVTNQKCKELFYVIKGSGKLVTGSNEVSFSDGDLLFVEAGENYCWEAQATVFTSSNPAWYPEQHILTE